jgi:hypothetical protein
LETSSFLNRIELIQSELPQDPMIRDTTERARILQEIIRNQTSIKVDSLECIHLNTIYLSPGLCCMARLPRHGYRRDF